MKTFIGPLVTKVAIVYGKGSGHVRRHIYATWTDQEYEDFHTLLPGEAMCFVPIGAHHAGHDIFHRAIRASVQNHGNVRAVMFADDPGAIMFAHVDRATGVVDNITMADPDIDANLGPLNWKRIPDGQTVHIGFRFKKGTFIDPRAGWLTPKQAELIASVQAA